MLKYFNRHSFFLIILILIISLIGCSKSTQGGDSGTTPPPNNQQTESPGTEEPAGEEEMDEWAQLEAAAKAEGKLIMTGDPSQAYRNVLQVAFQNKYPEIEIEYSGVSATDYMARVRAEQEAGQYLWDIRVRGISSRIYNITTCRFYSNTTTMPLC